MSAVNLEEPSRTEPRINFNDPELLEEIEHAAHVLPSQGPITVFVHHNTLHAFEDLSFDEGVRTGGQLWGCHAYLPEEHYRKMLLNGRIRVEDLETVLREDEGDDSDQLIDGLCTLHELKLGMMQFPLHCGPTEELRWAVAESDALRRFRKEVDPVFRQRVIDDTRARVNQLNSEELVNGNLLSATLQQFNVSFHPGWDDRTWEAFTLNYLWRVCSHGVRQAGKSASFASTNEQSSAQVRRHRDVLLDACGQDADLIVHEILIRFCSAFLDQGFAHWQLPERSAGLFKSFLKLYQTPLASPTRWLSSLKHEAIRISRAEMTALDSIHESLDLLGVTADERAQFITQTLLALRGWAGMVWQMETNAEWAPHPAPAGSLVEFLAVRLILERLALQQVAHDSLGCDSPLNELRNRLTLKKVDSKDDSFVQRAFTLFQLAQVLGWLPSELENLSGEQWAQLVGENDAFSSLERRGLYHRAFERKYCNETLDAVVVHSQRVRKKTDANQQKDTPPKFQLVTCIDDREESFRRHLEEIDPDCETLGIPGFYGTAMYYRGVGQAHFKPLCPIAIKPSHYVVEEPLYSLAEVERRRSEARRTLGLISHRTHLGTRSFVGGILTTLGGSLAAFPLVGRILFPRAVSQVLNKLSRIVNPPQTQLRIERVEPTPGLENGQLGYSVEEMTQIVEGVLRAAGLTQRWSRLVILLGHGSESLNNPHESAYNCGACAGSQGGPNARAFALMANDFRVRHNLSERGLPIPDSTWFVGGYHDTTNESVTFADLDRMPASHRGEFESVVHDINEARERNAHERCRRFESASLDISISEALRHVEDRPEDLSQARPEYNHATNALCFVGKREWSRGLFLDRRAFLTSYDSRQDDEQGTILEGILRAAIPVCAGINLEYYFSTVDVEGYGCGSKLPHNITSLLGVMSGAASDLRPGLSQQMIEIHEPMRLIFVIETCCEVMLRIIHNNESIRKLVEGGWVQLAILDPETSLVELFQHGKFVPYTAKENEISTVMTSRDWYQGRRDHLAFASITASDRRPVDNTGAEA